MTTRSEYFRFEAWCSYLPDNCIGGYQKDETKIDLVYFDEQEQCEARAIACAVIDEIFESARRMRKVKGMKNRERKTTD